MEILLSGLPFLISALLAGIMGFAIQRGATCTVAAVDEVVSKRRFDRLGSMIEASLWVVGGLLIAQSIGLLGMMPAGYAVSYWTVTGAALLDWARTSTGRACSVRSRASVRANGRMW